jgi:hypothetical protein
MCDPLARLLEMRLRFRRNPQARTDIDRALAAVAAALAGDPDFAALDREAMGLAERLTRRFEAPHKVTARQGRLR